MGTRAFLYALGFGEEKNYTGDNPEGFLRARSVIVGRRLSDFPPRVCDQPPWIPLPQ